jgi:DNA-binding MarR family transcriptional regulator
MNDLAQQAVLSGTGLVRLVDPIEAAAGLLRREPVPEDRRGAYGTITDAGIETLKRMWPVYARGSSSTSLSRWAATRPACAGC